ncbi:uncharacterized protein LOC134469426 [Engraulis encrasicolus]|uniref:uncharacterized protein LOC134469426 n=1 Tax=Engraulis encrasicolus TaxID=184585 RepID=UPI002FD0E626
MFTGWLRQFPFSREARERGIRHQIQLLSSEAVRAIEDAGLDEIEILDLSRQDLQELLPGSRHFKLRRKIAELINAAKQGPPKESPDLDSSDGLVQRLRDLISRDHVQNSPVASAVLEDYLHILRDTEQQLACCLELLRQRVKQLEDLRQPPSPPPPPPPAPVQHNNCHFGAAAVCPVPPFRNEAHPTSPVPIHSLVYGKTLGFHADVLRRVGVGLAMREAELDECQAVLLFCPVFSRTGTDIDAALNAAPRNKDVVMVIMHYTYYPQQSLTRTNSSYPANICTVAHIFFHDSGLLSCESNRQAIADIEAALKNYTSVH